MSKLRAVASFSSLIIGLMTWLTSGSALAHSLCQRPTLVPTETSLIAPAGLRAQTFDGSALSAWMLNQSACVSRTQVIRAPGVSSVARTAALSSGASANASALHFTADDDDVAPLTPTANPRAQLVSPLLIHRNHDYWESFEVYLPPSFPRTQPTDGWISLQTVMYGRPFNGTPPASLSVEDGQFRYELNGYGPHPWALAWSKPEVRGRWVRFTWHFRASQQGWVELWVDGRRQALSNGARRWRRMPVAMIDPTDDLGQWYTDLQLYYKHGEFPSLSVDFRDFRLGASRDAVLG
jgi:hypothetical protein